MDPTQILDVLEIDGVPEDYRKEFANQHLQLYANFLFIKLSELLTDEEVENIYSAEDLVNKAKEKYPDFDKRVKEITEEYISKLRAKKEAQGV